MHATRSIVLGCAALAGVLACAWQALGASSAASAAEAADTQDAAAASGAPDCTLLVDTPDEASAAAPGDVVCFAGDLAGERLVITHGGTAADPVTYRGRNGAVRGIDIEADHVVVRGFVLDEPEAPGVWMEGTGITLRDTTITSPQGGDGDGIRFFGSDLTILNNTITGTDNSTGAHADCMQTYASDSPPSRDVLIQGNRCEEIDNMGLMAEGPNDGEGDGEGTTSDLTIRDNYFETLDASQALMFEDVRNVTISGNTFAAPTHHAIGLAIGSTGARVTDDNAYDPGIGYWVGIDDSSLPGYEGPEPGGQP
ncbi:right-handed parallel beta-helix repeat-containing protein [Streptomyces sp. 6N223]|uniref:right-handed parallel beta-helix repeat-containing protein n=1 Tax=Streptomyces sp. 6N223 TaxID=3457412 RepID=UPI003FD559A8